MAGHAHPGECVGVAARRRRTPHWPGSRPREGVSLAVLARRAAAAAVEAAGGRVAMPAPAAVAVEELRAAGHALNRLLPAMSTASTDAQRGAIAARITAALDRITVAAAGCGSPRPPAPALRVLASLLVGVGGGWCG